MPVDGPDKPNRSGGRKRADDGHLHCSFEACNHVLLSAPSDDNASLSPSEGEERHYHDANTPPQRGQYISIPKNDVREQWNESAQEITGSDRYGANHWSTVVWLAGLVMEAHEEVQKVGFSTLKALDGLAQAFLVESVRCKASSRPHGGLGRLLSNDCSSGLHGRPIRLSVVPSDPAALTASDARTHASLLAPMKPPRPIEMAPATNSASPPKTTTCVSLKALRPADSAKGTVSPSDRPMMASEIIRGPGRIHFNPHQPDDELSSSDFLSPAACASKSELIIVDEVANGLLAFEAA